MIDIKEPVRVEYGPEEKENLVYRLLILLHSMLLLYLALHSLIIPLLQNVYFFNELFNNVRFWFLFQIPVQYYLRKKRPFPRGYFYFLVLGSTGHLLFNIMTLPDLKSWTFLSLLISEFAAFIFYFIYYSHKSSQGTFSPVALWGLVIPAILGSVEIHNYSSSKPHYFHNTKKVSTASYGCKGSTFELSFPKPELPLKTNLLSIKSCGLSEKAITFDNELSVINKTGRAHNLRLYVLKIYQGRISWKFKRLVRIEDKESWHLMSDLKADNIYVIKSPEYRALGSTIILPAKLSKFLLGKGRINFTYDTLEWVQDG